MDNSMFFTFRCQKISVLVTKNCLKNIIGSRSVIFTFHEGNLNYATLLLVQLLPRLVFFLNTGFYLLYLLCCRLLV